MKAGVGSISSLYILRCAQRTQVPSMLATQIGISGASVDESSGSLYVE